MITQTRASQRRKVLTISIAVFVLLATWVAIDLYAPRKAQLREFDADEVARLETAMWRSYYEKRRASLFMELAELLRTQYNMPLIRSNVVAYRAAKAAIVFQRGKQRSDYEKALPDLVHFYRAIRDMSDEDFNVDEAAKLELEWWIIHRERAKHDPVDLSKALADLQAAIYRMPAEAFAEHARLRAEAMTIRDTKAEQGGVTEADWATIDQLLHQSWQSLKRVVKK